MALVFMQMVLLWVPFAHCTLACKLHTSSVRLPKHPAYRKRWTLGGWHGRSSPL
jgi:hypothetical protein